MTEKVTESVSEAAKALGLNEKSVRTGIQKGEIPCLKIGRRHLIPMWWIKLQRDGHGAPERQTT